MTVLKFLVVGDVKGNFKCLFTKLRKAIKLYGPFQFLLCTGSFFSEDAHSSEWDYYNSHPEKIPIKIYILGPNSLNEVVYYDSTIKSSNINENIVFVGKTGIFTTPDGVKIAYLSGLDVLKQNPAVALTEIDVKKLISNKTTVDIVFTSQWPHGITDNYMTDFKPLCSSQLLPKVIKALKPRYFFSGVENKFYERVPICHLDSSGNVESLTKFVGLAFVTDLGKEKSIYAVNMTLKRTICPEDLKKMNQYLQYQPSGTTWTDAFFNVSFRFSHPSTCKLEQKQKLALKTPKIPKQHHLKVMGNCWFCFSNGGDESHLVIDVGNHVYLSLSKGGLVREHMCLVPIKHISSISQADDEIKTNLKLYKDKIIEHYRKKSMEVIFYERHFKALHAQVQCVPLEKHLHFHAKSAFLRKASEIGLKFSSYSPKDKILNRIPPAVHYFHVDMSNGEELFVKIPAKCNFPLDFGREALVMPDVLDDFPRASWKHCLLSYESEVNVVADLKREINFQRCENY